MGDKHQLQYGPQYRLSSMSDKQRQVYNKLASGLSKQDKVLDLCCGEGRFMSGGKRDFSIYGMDINGVKIAKHRKKEKDKVYTHNIVQPLRWKDNFFSTVVFWRAYHYFSRRERKSILNEIRRVVKTGGMLYMLASSRTDWKYVNMYGNEKRNEDLLDISSHYEDVRRKHLMKFFTRKELLNEVQESKFDIKYMKEIQERSGFVKSRQNNTYWFVEAKCQK